MNHILLLAATILMWIAVFVGLYQRVFEMPKWFARPPASFELIRRQSKPAKAFWIPVSSLFIIAIISSFILNWHNHDVRNYTIATLASYGLTAFLSGIFFIREVIAFTKIPVNAPPTRELIKRTKFWLEWTSIRDVLHMMAAIFVTMAYIHL